MITKRDRYVGIIPVPSLLRRITEMRIQNARYANPLTLLPGNVPINQAIDNAILAEAPFSVLYFDLNNFKPYNDVYGYNQGDRIIQWFAQLLYEVFSPNEHFVGHVGGDDFIVVIHDQEHFESLLDTLKNQFQRDIVNFYRAEHLAEHAIFARARDGRFQRFPLLDYSVAIVKIAPHTAHSHQQVATIAAELKGKAKRAKNGIAIREIMLSNSEKTQHSP
ncbi:GGDEF domain-containing protein [Aliidiomarina celeris]|uniref:GGDEF domain-containing protein n=1 Tax=Aliidiomarina celeris TaxID=2249428 RepID=UPI000DEB7F5F|nr:GGDEF domain-containing protein [Aliidiomarina celeris]